MFIDKWKQEGGIYLDDNNCQWDNAEDFIHGFILGFCCCGYPELSLQYVRDTLNYINNPQKIPYDQWVDEGLKLFGSESAKYFTLYVMDNFGLTDHGGSINGSFLTDKGHNILNDLNILLNNE